MKSGTSQPSRPPNAARGNVPRFLIVVRLSDYGRAGALFNPWERKGLRIARSRSDPPKPEAGFCMLSIPRCLSCWRQVVLLSERGGSKGIPPVALLNQLRKG